MARIRTIKPEFWSDEVVATLSPWARLLFIGTWNLADDEGRLRWTPDYLNASLFMYDHHSTAKVRTFMDEVESAGLVVAYVGGKAAQRLAYLPGFLRHQKINRPQPSKLPAPESLSPSLFDSVNDSVNDAMTQTLSDQGTLSDPRTPEGKGAGKGTGKGREGTAAAAKSPQQAIAESVVRDWWESHDPRPPNSYIGVLKVVEKLVKSGADPRALRRALDDAPTPSVGALQVAMARQGPATSHNNGRILTDRDGPSIRYVPEEAT